MQSANYKFKNLNEVTQRIKQNINLTSVMADAGIAITTGGTGTVKVRCFEHEDDTPSLAVSIQKQLFNCFGAGCRVGGDVIAFAMQFYRMAFNEAINYLVVKYSLDVRDLVVAKSEEERQQDRYAHINHEAAVHLWNQGRTNPHLVSLLKGKGIQATMAQEFLIGYASNAPAVCSYLRAKGATPADLETLQFTRDDLFTNRIIYPMFDLHGRITSFYGRAVGKAAAKYIGTSRVYKDKPHPMIDRMVPYGLHVARTHVSHEGGRLIMVEGHNDVLGLHSHGIRNVAAMMTSAPSERQYATLHDLHINNVIICPDGDEAGFRTIEDINKNRALHQQVKVMFMPGGADPDEFVRDQGPSAFKRLVMDAVYPIELIIKNVGEKYARSAPTAKIDLTTSAMKYMAHLSGFEREFAIDELSTVTGLDRSIIEESISSMDEGPIVDVELERKVIGECINDKARAIHAVTILGPEDFTAAKHSSMWRAVRAMVDADIDPFSREMFMTFSIDKGHIEEKDSNLVPTVQLGSMQSLDYATQKLVDLTLRRRLIKSATRLLVDAKARRSDVQEVLDAHMIQLATSSSKKTEVTTAAQQTVTVMELIHERMANPGIPGINVGPDWKKFMHCIMGFQKGHMLSVAGVTKTGKTTIAQNWNIQQLIHVGEPSLWINLEMSEADLVLRNLSILSGIDNNKMKAGNITPEDKHAIDRAAATYHGFKLHVANLAGANVFDVINCMRRFVYTAGVRIVYVDYVQLIRVDRARSKSALWEEQNDVVAALRDAISRLGVTGIIISQLNRGAMAEQSASGQFVSGTIKLIQDSDCFMGVRKKSKEEIERAPHTNSALQVEFNRHGPQGLEIDLNFKYGCLRMREV